MKLFVFIICFFYFDSYLFALENNKKSKILIQNGQKVAEDILKRKEDLTQYASIDDIVNLRRTLEKVYNKDELNARHGDNGDTLLMIATKKDNAKSVEFLLQKGANPLIGDVGLATPLHVATRKCNTQIVKILSRYIKEFDVKDIEGYTPIMRAIDFGCIESFKILFQNGSSLSLKNLSGQNGNDLINSLRDEKTKNEIKNIILKLKQKNY